MHFSLLILVLWQSLFHELWCCYCVQNGGWSRVFCTLMPCSSPGCAIKDKVFVVVHSLVWTPSPFVSSEAAALWCAASRSPSKLNNNNGVDGANILRSAGEQTNASAHEWASERGKEWRSGALAMFSRHFHEVSQITTASLGEGGLPDLIGSKEARGSDKTF